MKINQSLNLHIVSLCLALLIACEDDEPRAATRGFANAPAVANQGATSEGANIPEGVISEIKIPVPERFKVKELFTAQGWTALDKIRQSYQYSSTEQVRIRDPFFPDIPELKGETI